MRCFLLAVCCCCLLLVAAVSFVVVMMVMMIIVVMSATVLRAAVACLGSVLVTDLCYQKGPPGRDHPSNRGDGTPPPTRPKIDPKTRLVLTSFWDRLWIPEWSKKGPQNN